MFPQEATKIKPLHLVTATLNKQNKKTKTKKNNNKNSKNK